MAPADLTPPHPQARPGPVRIARRAALLAVAATAVCTACGTFVLALSMSGQAARLQEVHDGFWLSLHNVSALRNELLVGHRGRLADWLEQAARQPERRHPLARLADTGLLVVRYRDREVRVAAAPPGLPADRLQDPKLLQQLRDNRDLLPLGDRWCLPLPREAARAAAGWVSDLGREQLLLVACVTGDRLQAAAAAALPRGSEWSFWRDRQGLLRITRLADGRTTIETGFGSLPADVHRESEEALDLATLEGAWGLVSQRGHTVGPAQLRDEDRPTGRHRVHYVRRESRTGWTGYSFAYHDPAEAPELPWHLLLSAAVWIAAFPVAAVCAWRRIGQAFDDRT